MNPYSEQIAKIDELWQDRHFALAKSLAFQLPDLEAFVWCCRVRDLHLLEPGHRNNQVTAFGSPAFTLQDSERRAHLEAQEDHLCFGRANMMWTTATSTLCFILIPLRPFNYNRCSYPQMGTTEFYGPAD